MKIPIIRTNKMHNFLLIYFNNKPPHVSSRLAAHHEEDQLCTHSNWYSHHNTWLYQLLFIQSWLYVNTNPTRCNSMQIFIYCKVTLHVSGVTASIIRSTKNCNHGLRYRSWYWYSYFPPTWPNWREVAVPVLRPVPEAVVTVFSTPDDGCCDTWNM